MATQSPISTAAGSNNSNSNNNQAGPVNVQRPRDSILQRTAEDQRTIRIQDLFEQYERVCTCDTCNPSMYFNYPISCIINHAPDDIVVEPLQIPVLAEGSDCGAFEALSLARCTIEYFSRIELDMESTQLEALVHCRDLLRKGVLDAVLPVPASGPRSNRALRSLADALNHLFFFGAIKIAAIHWDADVFDRMPHTYGNTNTTMFDGIFSSHIRIHPTRKPDIGCVGQKLAEHRLGNILHELLHAFLTQHQCEICCVTARFRVDHGRQWQRVAKAIEDHSLRLLGMEANLGRCMAVQADRKLPHGRVQSVHDMQDWGFLENLPRAEN